MSFGPQRVGRHQASERSAAVRIARRLLLTGSCAVAGWIGASAIGGAAHAATPQDAAPLTSVLHSVDATHQLDGTSQSGPGLSESVHHAVSQVVQSRRTASITVRSAEHAGATSSLPAAPSPTRHSEDATGDLDKTLDSTRISGQVRDQVEHRLGDAGKSVSQLGDATKPVTRQVVAPITDTAQHATAPLTGPTAEVTKPIQSVTQTLSGTTPDLSNVTAPVTSTVHRVVSTVHHTVQHATPSLSLPGLSVPAGEQLGPVTVGTTPAAPVAGTTPVVRSTDAPQTSHIRAVHPTVASAHRVARAVRPGAATSAGPARTATELTAPIALDVPISHADHALPHRQPVTPIAPMAPPAPAGVGNGSGSGANANSSGSAGSSAPAALDADADAPQRTLGTVDPTDASMARSVSKRPSTSPD